MLPEESSIRFTRRTVLGLGAAALLAGQGRSQERRAYSIVQNGRCVPLVPFEGSTPVEERYGWGTDSDSDYSATGFRRLQRPETSVLFLYRGPNGLSLVLIHDAYRDGTDGGSVSMTFQGLPRGGTWLVRDDQYGDSANFDRWDLRDREARIDWTWDTGRTDGAVYRGLDGTDLRLRIRPAFNEAAALFGEYYEGRLRRWQALSGPLSAPTRHDLELDEPLAIRATRCGTQSDEESKDDERKADDRDRDDERERNDDDDDEERDDDDDDDEERDDDDDDDEERDDDDDEEEEDEEEERGRGPPPWAGGGKGNGEDEPPRGPPPWAGGWE